MSNQTQAGAWYVYARRAFGNYFGFVTGITSWLGTVSALGFGAYTMSEYIALLIPDTESYIQLMSVVVLAILTGFHWLGTKSARKITGNSGSHQSCRTFYYL
ncbi:MAG: APC family permease [Saprospiraceae bacterium]|nr:APC family permease [Saprospiraceae bacterium]